MGKEIKTLVKNLLQSKRVLAPQTKQSVVPLEKKHCKKEVKDVPFLLFLKEVLENEKRLMKIVPVEEPEKQNK